MARTNDSTETIRGSIEGSPKSSTTATASDDHALAEYRVQRFMSEETSTITTLALHPNRNASAEAVKSAAKDRMAMQLLAFDTAFGQPTTGAT